MLEKRCRSKVERFLSVADVVINGDRPWDMTFQNDALYRRLLTKGSLGLGESYMDGWWECKELEKCIFRLVKADVESKIKSWTDRWQNVRSKVCNLQKLSRAYQVGQRHYDIGNELYRVMLDRRMIYSCGYWKDAADLDEAQEAKLDLVCRKLKLKPGMRVLDIGCGWGGAAKFAAEEYGVKVVGITISKEQADFARENCRGLPIDIRLQDYRLVNEKFDRILSIGMFEHVGYKNYRIFMEVVRRCLDSDGLFLLHTIGTNYSGAAFDTWFERYIFPNAKLPSAKQLATAFEGVFILEDWHNFGVDYHKTLIQWYHNFNDHWHLLKGKYDERFHRMWKYYLLSAAGAFRARNIQLWQIVLSPRGAPGGYQAPR